jgi:hypothetical protein
MRCRALGAFALLCAVSGCGDNMHLTGGTLLISPEVGLRTNETGTNATFTVSLTEEPSKNIEVTLTSLDLGEGMVTPAMLRFTPVTYDRPQLVMITGVDDERADGNQAFIVRVDGGRRGIVDLSIVNDDDDTAGFVISPLIGLQTTEAGTQASFSVRLLSQPAADVTVPVQSSANVHRANLERRSDGDGHRRRRRAGRRQRSVFDQPRARDERRPRLQRSRSRRRLAAKPRREYPRRVGDTGQRSRDDRSGWHRELPGGAPIRAHGKRDVLPRNE